MRGLAEFVESGISGVAKQPDAMGEKAVYKAGEETARMGWGLPRRRLVRLGFPRYNDRKRPGWAVDSPRYTGTDRMGWGLPRRRLV